MTREERAAIFGAGVARRLVPALVERCGLLLGDEAEAVARDVIAAEFLKMLAPPDAAGRGIRDAFAAGFAED